VNSDSIPLELKQYPYWCVWKYVQKPGKEKPGKVPYQPLTGQTARSNDPNTFTIFAAAEQAYKAGGYDGIGVGVFKSLVAIDIDDCFDPVTRQMSKMALDIINMLGPTYIEISPSGKGLRLFLFAPDFRYDKTHYYIKNSKLGLEIYVAGHTSRFVTVTGNVYGFPLSVAECSTTLPSVLEKYMLRSKATDAPLAELPAACSILNDEQVIEKIRKEPNQKFAALYDSGNWQGSGYPSQSEADQALCNKLAFYCGCDTEQIDRLFRQSGLHREEKWERDGYRRSTIAKAVRDCPVVYNPASAEYQHILVMRDFASIGGFQSECIINPLSSKERYSFNDKGNGYLFADLFADKLRYCPQAKSWYVYRSGKWEPDIGDATARECAKKCQITFFFLYRKRPTLSARHLKRMPVSYISLPPVNVC